MKAQIRVPFYGHYRQYCNLKEKIDLAISTVIQSEQYTLGPYLEKFEAELADFFGMKYAIGVNNGTDAIWLTLVAMGLTPEDECLTTSNTFFATVEAAWLAQTRIGLVDCTSDTRCIDTNALVESISDNTRALIPVHLYGQCADMNAVNDIAKNKNLFVIEDAAQAINARGKNFRIGELSNAVTISFIAQKNLGTFGDSGAILTNDSSLASELRILRNHGSKQRNVHKPGFNSRLDDLHAAILSEKLKYIPEWSDIRIQRADEYTKALSSFKNLTTPVCKEGYRHVYHLYVIEAENHKARDSLLSYLVSAGIDAKTHYSIPIHKQEGFPWGRPARISGKLTECEENAACCISLPMFPEITNQEINFVIEKVSEWAVKHENSF